MASMKVSVSLPGEDIEFLDGYAREQGLESRSAALHKAVRLLRAAELAAAYESAWDEWSAHEDASLWDLAVSDGLVNDAPR
jgi:Arc/MetJ-type ribon-helix-helix transcriptional regulator